MGLPAGAFWAITTHFNPAGYEGRRRNYRLFRERLKLPLLTVELAFGSDFELDEDDADILIQLRGGDVMWQKERLLNVAIDALPAGCRDVAWLDCDIIFEKDDWAERAAPLLDRFAMIQPFGQAFLMPRDWQPGASWSTPEGVLRPPASYVAAGISAAACLGDISPPIVCAPGLAWVARRDLLERHRLYDAAVVGGGDNVMAASAYGCFDIPAAHQQLDAERKNHYLAWAIPFHQAVGGRVGFIEGNLYHLWHGSRENRRYAERHQGLTRFDFNPASDLAVAESGAWRWNSAKPDLHDFVRNYFVGRKEDG